MMASRETSSENDVLYEFAMTYQHPDIDHLDEYIRKYPSYANALTVLAFEFALDASLQDSESLGEEPAADPKIDTMLSRAMSRFQNLLFEIRDQEKVSASKPDLKRPTTPSGDLLAQRTPEQMQTLCRRLDVSPLFLKRLRDREIRADTIPNGFVALFAEGIERPESEVAAFLGGRPQIALHLRFKSETAPTVGAQMSFEDAVRKSALSPEQQTRLLAFMRDAT